MNAFGLPSPTLQALQNVFMQNGKIEKVTLYGSRAIGTFKIGSDIDLCITGPQMTLTELLHLENEIDDLLLPYKIDLSLRHQIENSDLLAHIDQFGIALFPVAPA